MKTMYEFIVDPVAYSTSEVVDFSSVTSLPIEAKVTKIGYINRGAQVIRFNNICKYITHKRERLKKREQGKTDETTMCSLVYTFV